MSPKHPHAAESGVGKHTTRESERAQACAAGKERVANAHPHKLAPEASKTSGAFFVFRDRDPSRVPGRTAEGSYTNSPADLDFSPGGIQNFTADGADTADGRPHPGAIRGRRHSAVVASERRRVAPFRAR